MDPVDGPWLFGYGLTGFKSLRGDTPAKVGPLGKVNFLVGRNNHGKSTVMRAAALWANRRETNPGESVETMTMVPVPAAWLRRYLRVVADMEQQLVDSGQIALINDDQYGVWLPGRIGKSAPEPLLRAIRAEIIRSGQGMTQPPSPPPAPTNVVTIPAFRQLRPGRKPESVGERQIPDLASGEGLVEELGRWFAPENPGSPQYDQAQARWIQLRDFLREVLEEPDAQLEVANNQRDLHVRLSQGGRMLHIDELGDGIKQVLMIAAASILYDDHLVLLEEPEIHLHAGLQRKLLAFLANETQNQYLIATHSAHVLDLPGARIFHVTHDGVSTRVSPAIRASDVQQVCQDLGYMASDLLQANYTIWVEGPSDRTYWQAWLRLVDPELVEGVHFAIMNYGGYLIDYVHLRDEPHTEIKELVHLLRLGRRCTVIADSDKKAESDELRETLRRLADEASSPGSGHLLVCEWVSTVENMVPRDLFREVVLECHSTAGQRLKTGDSHGPFDDPFAGMGRSTFSKVDIAQRVAERITLEHMSTHLVQAANDLAGRIRTANGLRPRDSVQGDEAE